MCGEITFPPRINYTFRQWFQTIKRRSALKNQRFVTKKKMRRKWSPHISRERSRVLGTNLLSLFFLCSFSAGKTNRRGFFVWEDRGDSIRLELSFPRARTQEFNLKFDSILVAAFFSKGKNPGVQPQVWLYLRSSRLQNVQSKEEDFLAVKSFRSLEPKLGEIFHLLGRHGSLHLGFGGI